MMVSMQALVWLTVWTSPVLLVVGCRGSEDGTTTTAAPATTVEFKEGQVLVEDDFSDSSGWSSDVTEEGETGYVEGAYRILAKPAKARVESVRGGDERFQAFRLEVDATQVAGRSGDYVGVRCYTSYVDDVGYELAITPTDRGYGIAAFAGDDRRFLETAEEAVDVIHPVGEENQLRVECVSSPDGQSILTLEANGEVLVRAEDETERSGFDGFGLVVGTREGGAEALFDDFVLTELVHR
jgi:hypothetical protein